MKELKTLDELIELMQTYNQRPWYVKLYDWIKKHLHIH